MDEKIKLNFPMNLITVELWAVKKTKLDAISFSQNLTTKSKLKQKKSQKPIQISASWFKIFKRKLKLNSYKIINKCQVVSNF